MMESPSNTPFKIPNRRTFLWSLAGFGLTGKALALKSEKESETVYRIRTPECDVRMSVEYYGNSQTSSLRFRDDLTQRAFCLSANGEEDPSGKEDRSCVARFSGSIAIAHYHFRSRLHAQPALHMRERVLTVDHDNRMDPRPPFERLLDVQRETVSDIQAFGYRPPQPSAPDAKPLALWCFLRQDLFLNEQPTAFLIITPSMPYIFSM